MKKVLIIATIILSSFMSIICADIVLIIKNIDVDLGGEIAFGVYRENNWLDEKDYNYSSRQAVTGSTMHLTIKDIKPGKYAIAGYHDTNKNHKLDKNFIGMPTEQIGFSNGAKIGFGPPSFEEAQINIEEDKENKFIIIMD